MPGKFLKVIENRATEVALTATEESKFRKSHLEVRMFNVGKGEAILLVFPEQRAWLLEGGCGKNLSKLGPALAAYLKERKLVLEALVLSHPHIDHGGAIAALLSLIRQRPELAAKVTFYRSDDPRFSDGADWLKLLRPELGRLGARLEEEIIQANGHREVQIAAGVDAHLFTGGATKASYRSVFLHLRFKDARLLFTGDAYCEYECNLLDKLGDTDFRADVLKVTHHGSSTGTAKRLVSVVKPGIAIASTADDGGHRLERDTMARLRAGGAKRQIHETLIKGDIILRTDGRRSSDGVLYQVEFELKSKVATAIGADTQSSTKVNKKRTTSSSNDAKKCKTC